MTGIEFVQRFFPATSGNTHMCRNKRRSRKLTIVISNSESVMSARVQKMLPELKRISRMKEKDRKKFIATCGKDVIHCICECSKNLLKGNLPLKQRQLKSLSRHKHWLRKLALKKTTLSKRKNILQKGGFLHLLIPTLVSSLSGLVGNLVSNGGR
jgi:hypothetical protein